MSNPTIYNQLKASNGSAVYIDKADEWVHVAYIGNPAGFSLWFYIPLAELDSERVLFKPNYDSGNYHAFSVNANRTITCRQTTPYTTTATVKAGWNFFYVAPGTVFLNGVLETPSFTFWGGVTSVEIGRGCKYHIDDFVIYFQQPDYTKVYNGGYFRQFIKSSEWARATLYLSCNEVIEGSLTKLKVDKKTISTFQAFYAKTGFESEYADNTKLYADGVNDITTTEPESILFNNGTIEFWAKPLKTGSVPTQSNVGTNMFNSTAVSLITALDNSTKDVHLSVSVGRTGVSVGYYRYFYYPAVLSHGATITPYYLTHFAIVIDNKVPSLYINGTLVKTGLPPNTGDPTANVLLRLKLFFPSNTQQYFQGDLRDLRVWNVVRTAAQINNNKNAQLQGDEPGLIRLVTGERIGGSFGTQLLDKTGNSSLTLMNYNYSSPPTVVLKPRRPIM